MNKLHIKRLKKLISILEAADDIHDKRKEPSYDQYSYMHSCGTPACALGHYVASNKRWVLINRIPFLKNGNKDLRQDTKDEFGITSDESDQLFGPTGCGRARTAKQAAWYIRQFLDEKLAKV